MIRLIATENNSLLIASYLIIYFFSFFAELIIYSIYYILREYKIIRAPDQFGLDHLGRKLKLKQVLVMMIRQLTSAMSI